MPPSLYVRLIIAAIGLLSVGGINLVLYEKGVSDGKQKQELIDKKAIDDVNRQIENNKAIATRLYQQSQQQVIDIQRERDIANHKLEEEHDENIKTINDIKLKYANDRLRFKSENVRSRDGSSNTMSTSGITPSNNETTNCELPREITQRLQTITYDADVLLENYIYLYNFVHKNDVKK